MKLKGNKRLEDETYLEFQVRRDMENAFLKERKKGKLVHNSSYKGTYKKEEAVLMEELGLLDEGN